MNTESAGRTAAPVCHRDDPVPAELLSPPPSAAGAAPATGRESPARLALARQVIRNRYGGRRQTITAQAFRSAAAAADPVAAGAGSSAPPRAPATPTRTGTPSRPSAGGARVTGRVSRPERLTLPRPPFAVRMLDQMTYGATQAAIDEFDALGGSDLQRLQNWVDWQLDWEAIDDGAVEARLAAAGYGTLAKSLTRLWSEHVAVSDNYDLRMRPSREVQRATFVRAMYSRRQLFERMVEFWHDHFNVTCTDFVAGPVYVHYHRDVIRANALGNFRTMLEEVVKSTAMMYYLDNVSNTRAGPNENWARELLELHTLGAVHYLGFMDPFEVPPDPDDANYPAGYTDIDVYETAAAFTGWSVRNGHWQYPSENDGTFVYRQAWHDAGPKFVLGRLLNPEQPAMKDGRDILDRLASHPATARFVCSKLIRRFITDTPPASLVRSAAAVFRQHWQSPDQIARVMRHILTSDAMYNAWGQKQRRPFEAIVAALRAGGCDFTVSVDSARSGELMWKLGFTGHVPYEWPAPNGYPDVASAWSGANSYAMTWELLGWLTEARTDGDTGMLLPIVDISRSQVPTWTATALVDYWCRRLLGYLPVASRRNALIAFMAQNGDPQTYVITDTDSWAGSDLKRHYNHQRLRSMVALILMSPEFLTR